MEKAGMREKGRRPIAHLRSEDRAEHDLAEHLAATSNKAVEFASPWGAEAEAEIAGRWHDLGKYAPAFQDMIRAVGTEGHLERGKVNHAYAGAQLAKDRLAPPTSHLLSLVIAGHHGGLPDWSGEGERPGLKQRLGTEPHLSRAMAGGMPAALLDAPALPELPAEVDAGLWTRMLASAVYDADFLDTEAFFNAAKGESRVGWTCLGQLPPIFERKLAEKLAGARPCPVDSLRAEVLAACRTAAQDAPGLFSLTVPTGGGKTLSSLAFALSHAVRHGLRRVIYAVPFTSVIEQTAQEFRGVLGPNAVLEHHSALDPDQESNAARLAAENWDAPVVVTTTVQLFESLFASRTSQLRKLHNLAGSVLVLDEAQALPPGVLRPVTAVLDQLARHYRISVVLCTATQPALEAVFQGFKPREIAPAPHRLFAELDRVTTSIPAAGQHRSWDDVASQMSAERQTLSIVNTRADCRALFARLPAGSVHLSTFLCAAHRRRLLDDIKDRLTNNEPVRVASTSLVEAGVDIDFPTVFRAMAGLDALAQAAGRCNRNGRLAKGRFVVFRPEGSVSWPDLAQTIGAAEAALRLHAAAPFRPEAFIAYFKQLYWLKGDDELDRLGMMKLLRLSEPGRRCKGQRHDISFRTAAERFHMIEPDHRASVVVPYDEAARAAIALLRSHGPDRTRLRALQRFTVPVAATFLVTGAVEMVHGVPVLIQDDLYRDDIGLDAEGAG
jgi:CRISPR-associated endonuclease/helicase Cas3